MISCLLTVAVSAIVNERWVLNTRPRGNFRASDLRMQTVHEDEATLEELIGMGQLEELIESQTEELGVLRMYVQEEMWTVIAELDTPEFKTD